MITHLIAVNLTGMCLVGPMPCGRASVGVTKIKGAR
jgi:hypothetical protein